MADVSTRMIQLDTPAGAKSRSAANDAQREGSDNGEFGRLIARANREAQGNREQQTGDSRSGQGDQQPGQHAAPGRKTRPANGQASEEGRPPSHAASSDVAGEKAVKSATPEPAGEARQPTATRQVPEGPGGKTSDVDPEIKSGKRSVSMPDKQAVDPAASTRTDNRSTGKATDQAGSTASVDEAVAEVRRNAAKAVEGTESSEAAGQQGKVLPKQDAEAGQSGRSGDSAGSGPSTDGRQSSETADQAAREADIMRRQAGQATETAGQSDAAAVANAAEASRHARAEEPGQRVGQRARGEGRGQGLHPGAAESKASARSEAISLAESGKNPEAEARVARDLWRDADRVGRASENARSNLDKAGEGELAERLTENGSTRRALEQAVMATARRRGDAPAGQVQSPAISPAAFSGEVADRLAADTGLAREGLDRGASEAPGFTAAARDLGVLGSSRPTVTASVNVPVNQPGFDQAVGNRVSWMVGQNVNSAQLQLNPARLGPVDVSIEAQGDQANIQFVANNPATREAMEAALPRLKEMLAEQGFSQVDVSVGQNGQEQAGGDGDGDAGGTLASGEESGEAAEQSGEPVHHDEGMIQSVGVDYFA